MQAKFTSSMNSAPPRFRNDVRIRRQLTSQGVSYVVKDPATEKFFRFREAERFITEQLDGETASDVIRKRVEEKFGAQLSPETLGSFIYTLDNSGLLDNENSSRRKSSRKTQKRWRGSLLYLRYQVLNPERILEYLIHRVRFFFSSAFVKLSAAAIFIAILITIENWSEYISDVPRLLQLEAIPVYLVLGFIVISGHEFAHGLTCRHFGGKVREMGFMFIYFQPGFYCNVSDAWLFPEKSRRMWVGFAGMYFEFFVWAIAVVLWRITDTDTNINYLSLMVMTGSGIATLANLNPLIKLDGYYLLSDYLDIPNLRRKSFRYVGDSLKSVFGLAEKPGEGYSQRERGIFMTYGAVATLASFSLMTFATFELGSFLIEQSQPFALTLLLGLVGTRFRTRLKRLFGKSTKDDEDFEDDVDTSSNDMGKNMRDAFRNDAPPAIGHENQRRFRLRPSEPEVGPDRPVRDEQLPRTLRPLPPLTTEQKSLPDIAPVQERVDSPSLPREEKKREEKKERSSKSSRRKKKRKMNPVVLGVLAGLAVILLVFGWMQLRITGPFNILPIQYADVRAEVDGIITEILVREGDLVKQGSLVARISDKEQRSQLQQTQAQIDRARAQLRILETGPMKVEIDVAQAAVNRATERAKFEQSRVGRSKLLYEKEILSLMEYESALQQLNAAENDLIEAQKRLTALVRGIRPEQISSAKAELSGLLAQMPALEQNLQRAEVRSPVSGVVSTPARQLKELLYQKVDRGTLIARVSNSKKLTVEIALSEKDVADVKVGHTVAFKARSYPDETFYGVVTAAAQTAGVPATQTANVAPAQTPSASATTIIVTSEIDNSSQLLKPGMTGHAKIYCGERRIISLIFRRLMQTIKVEFWSWW